MMEETERLLSETDSVEKMACKFVGAIVAASEDFESKFKSILGRNELIYSQFSLWVGDIARSFYC